MCRIWSDVNPLAALMPRPIQPETHAMTAENPMIGIVNRRACSAATIVKARLCERRLSQLALSVVALLGAVQVAVADGADAELAKALSNLSPTVVSNEKRASAGGDLRARLNAANDESRAAWQTIHSRKDWDEFRAARVRNLRRGLGHLPNAPKGVRTLVTGTIEADGYAIETLVYESRPGGWVTANLYRPAKPAAALPGIILSHSHHAPKHEGELQDMGATWARAGCYVLVPDHIGHGERAQHGFRSSADYPREFRLSRQDYYFRYDSSIQLNLIGESLMGYMAWDLMRGVDVLLAQNGIDKDRIILLGGVAGGGDPCAVSAALDERIACAVPFNFGGPQPETRYPLPDDADSWFNYAGGGSWESTRNLAFSARPGKTFLPWEIVAAIAPRRLVYGHEFAWDREQDPVWRRLERVWELHDARLNLAFTHGRGQLTGASPEASHCNNIGAIHRARIHESFASWFGIRATEFSQRQSAGDLAAMTPAATERLKPRVLHELLAARADESLAAARLDRDGMSAAEARQRLRSQIAELLGDFAAAPVRIVAVDSTSLDIAGTTIFVERVRLKTERDLIMPLIVLHRMLRAGDHNAAVIGLSQSGKAGFFKRRPEDVAQLLRAGCIVCLPDVRDTGETAADESHGQFSASTERAASSLMVGDPLVAQQLRDARTVLTYLRGRDDVDRSRIAVWGASFARANAPETNLRVPRRVEGRPVDAEPLGGMLALLLALYDEDIAAVCVDRGLAEFSGALDRPFVYVPLESVVPGLLVHADLTDFTTALAPRPLMMCRLIDAQNRALELPAMSRIYEKTMSAYGRARACENLVITVDASAATWLVDQLN